MHRTMVMNGYLCLNYFLLSKNKGNFKGKNF